MRNYSEEFYEARRVIADRQYKLDIPELEELKKFLEEIIDTQESVAIHKKNQLPMNESQSTTSKRSRYYDEGN